MAAYGTRYLGGPKKLYAMSLRFPTKNMRIIEIKDSIERTMKAFERDDENYYFDDDGAFPEILNYIDVNDNFVYYRFICDCDTCKNIEKLRKYYGFQIEKTGGRWL